MINGLGLLLSRKFTTPAHNQAYISFPIVTGIQRVLFASTVRRKRRNNQLLPNKDSG
jgi:hypothetical protein